jgi:hypothetical protein
VYERLKVAFGANNVFLDVETLEPGQPFPREIAAHIARANVFLVLVGPGWTRPEQRARLMQKQDWVRREIELAQDAHRLLIPVLMGGATWPARKDLPRRLRPLLDLHGITLDSGRHYETDMTELIDAIRAQPQVRRQRAGQAAALVAAGVTGLGLLAWQLGAFRGQDDRGDQLARIPPPPAATRIIDLRPPRALREGQVRALVDQQRSRLTACLARASAGMARLELSLMGGQMAVSSPEAAAQPMLGCARAVLASVAWPRYAEPVQLDWTAIRPIGR